MSARVASWLVFLLLAAAGLTGTVWAVGHNASSTVSVSVDQLSGPTGTGLVSPPAAAGDVDTATAGPGGPVAATSQVAGWAARMASATGIPSRAMLAYGQAELVMAAEHRACHLSWSILAGIGSVESNHGRHGGASVGQDGRAAPPIVGPPLDGSGGNMAIRDTDGGALDGDRAWDRAVGPMQFIPTTWARWGVRASGDGAPPDPQNIDDAALAAARYLCASGRDLASGTGWWQAVLSYNHTTEYAQSVFNAAQRYAQASLGG